ncbi:MAG: chlorophyll a/b-binding protein [Phormidesmis sp.]
MENNLQTVSAAPSAAPGLENKTLGVDAARYYRPEPRLGFTPYAELWNGRVAMVGIVLALAFELLF